MLAGHAKGIFLREALFYVCIAAVAAASYLILWGAAAGSKKLSPIALNVMTRLMGLLLAAIGVQFILTGLTPTLTS